MDAKKKSLGIPNFGPWYLELLPNQNCTREIINIYSFLNSMIDSECIDVLKGNSINIQFINYGRTQLVFVVTVDNEKKYTLLVDQPATMYGTGNDEFNNLKRLNQIDSNIVIKPIDYYSNNNQELYITPYYYQSRCIGIEVKNWGMWIPEPIYHFEIFNDNQRNIINSTMVALLITLYDEENKKGIAKCRLDGGDFMLLKGFENNKIDFENIYNNIKLIAARKLIDISLDEYINRLRIELSNGIFLDDDLFIIGKRLKNSLSNQEIETGIELGLKLRKKNMQINL